MSLGRCAAPPGTEGFACQDIRRVENPGGGESHAPCDDRSPTFIKAEGHQTLTFGGTFNDTQPPPQRALWALRSAHGPSTPPAARSGSSCDISGGSRPCAAHSTVSLDVFSSSVTAPTVDSRLTR